MGETFNEWLVAEKIDLDGICKSGARQDNLKEQVHHAGLDNMHDAKQVNDFQKLLGERAQSEEDGRTCSDLQPIRDIGEGEWHDRRGLPADTEVGTRWTFANTKLVKKQDVYSTEITTEEFGFLKEAYGSPALITKTPQQNAFGARWTDILMTWHLPGGTTLYMKALGGTNDGLIITFVSKEHANRPVSREPNPYLPKPR
jgi:hypothetical protein